MRGAIFFVIAVIILLLFDHDERLDNLAVHECILATTSYFVLFFSKLKSKILMRLMWAISVFQISTGVDDKYF